LGSMQNKKKQVGNNIVNKILHCFLLDCEFFIK
jgi:hypothetical protein